MKTALASFLAFGALAAAQDLKNDRTPVPQDQKQQGDKRRLESVTWDLRSGKLIWVVQKGSEVDGKFVASSSSKYEITPDEAVMAFQDEKRAFTEEEATSLHHLLDVLSLYCAESTVWWDQGEGVPLDKDGAPAGPSKKKTEPEVKPHRVLEPLRNGRAETRVASLGVR